MSKALGLWGQEMLDQLKESYISEDTLTVDFVEDVRIAKGYVPALTLDSGATLAPIVYFKDPWQTLPGENASKGSADVVQPAADVRGQVQVAHGVNPLFEFLFGI